MENLFSFWKDKLLQTGYFLDNDWLNLYLQLIIKFINQERVEGKTQCHHILQRSYFNIIKKDLDNSKNNIVNLYYKDHILAHYYLALCTKEPLCYSNIRAVELMSGMGSLQEYYQSLKNKNYQSIYENYIKSMSKRVIDLNSGIIYKGLRAAGRAIGEDHRHISEQCYGKRLTFKGYNFRFIDDDDNIIEPIQKRIRPWKKKVICLNDLKIFDSIKEAANFYDLSPDQVSIACRKQIVTTKGLYFEYYQKDKNYTKKETLPYIPNGKRIRCIDKNLIFGSVSEAARWCNTSSRQSIVNCLNGKQKTAYGYKWEWVIEN